MLSALEANFGRNTSKIGVFGPSPRRNFAPPPQPAPSVSKTPQVRRWKHLCIPLRVSQYMVPSIPWRILTEKPKKIGIFKFFKIRDLLKDCYFWKISKKHNVFARAAHAQLTPILDVCRLGTIRFSTPCLTCFWMSIEFSVTSKNSFMLVIYVIRNLLTLSLSEMYIQVVTD